jgi:hypothetical protein
MRCRDARVAARPDELDLFGELHVIAQGRDAQEVGDPARPPAVLQYRPARRMSVEHGGERFPVPGGQSPLGRILRAGQGTESGRHLGRG